LAILPFISLKGIKMSTDTPAAPVKKPSSEKKAAKAVAAPVTKPETVAEKPKKQPKVKIIQDCFSMPKPDYAKIAEIKAACLKAGLSVKKNDVLCGGLRALGEMNAEQLARSMAGLGKVKAGK
jgi:tryptophanyl-tRNA synthetase